MKTYIMQFLNRIFLQMWDRMAEISFKHLKQNDLIHVSGQLGFYTKADDNGQRRPYHTVHNAKLFSQLCSILHSPNGN